MRPVSNPELPELARALPADTAYQITRTAERLGFTDYSDVLAEVANAVTRKAARPKGVLREAAPRLAGAGFPHPPLVTHPAGTGPTGCTGRNGAAATSTAPARPTGAGTPTPRQHHDHNELQLP